MLTRIHAAKCIGIEAVEVTVETDVERGIGIHLVGMADTAVKESLLRVVTAMTALKYKVPGKKIVINLAPADLRKSGSGYDLPIAVGIIAAATDVSMPFVNDYLIMGNWDLTAESGMCLEHCSMPNLRGQKDLKVLSFHTSVLRKRVKSAELKFMVCIP